MSKRGLVILIIVVIFIVVGGLICLLVIKKANIKADITRTEPSFYIKDQNPRHTIKEKFQNRGKKYTRQDLQKSDVQKSLKFNLAANQAILNPPANINIQDTKLATVPNNWTVALHPYSSSPDDAGYPYNSGVSFSPDGQKVAYLVRNRRDYFQCRMRVNSEFQGSAFNCYDFYDIMLFSPDSSKFAYPRYLEGIGDQVVLNGEQWSSYGNIYINTLTFSPDSSKLAYIGFTEEGGDKKGGGSEYKEYVVLNGDKKKEYDFVAELIFSPDSKKMAYIATNYQSGKYQSKVIINDIGGDTYDAIYDLKFSDDSQKISYFARQQEKQFFIQGDSKKEINNSYYALNHIFSNDGKHLAYSGYTLYQGDRLFIDYLPLTPLYQDGEIWDLKFLKNNDKIAFSVSDFSENGNDFISVYNIFSKKEIYRRNLCKGCWVGCVNLSPDNNNIAANVCDTTAGKDYIVKNRQTKYSNYDLIKYFDYLVSLSQYRYEWSANNLGVIYIGEKFAADYQSSKDYVIINNTNITGAGYFWNAHFNSDSQKALYGSLENSRDLWWRTKNINWKQLHDKTHDSLLGEIPK